MTDLQSVYDTWILISVKQWSMYYTMVYVMNTDEHCFVMHECDRQVWCVLY